MSANTFVANNFKIGGIMFSNDHVSVWVPFLINEIIVYHIVNIVQFMSTSMDIFSYGFPVSWPVYFSYYSLFSGNSGVYGVAFNFTVANN